ncbi:hypothetical protein CXB51_032293 [Gossypium anomalum]|uniref:Retrotransposon gag domain-containing protein n=1 Tax=Gossypium anomalum TaxID=47600 RepID=A0A8J6CLR9_9ROSI|nr:hypothetical protein CXB51_032293 [Gossypium anomalum]
MASICGSDMCLRVRPCLGQWHRFVATCKTTSGTLALYDLCDCPSVLSNSEWFIGQRFGVKLQAQGLSAKFITLSTVLTLKLSELSDKEDMNEQLKDKSRWTLEIRIKTKIMKSIVCEILSSFLPSSISTWQELAERFLVKYFPPSKNTKLRNETTTFQQLDDDYLYEAWERFKELLRKYPHHGIPHCIQLETFYNGLNAHTRLMVDATANGVILSKSYNEAYEIIERIASNNYQWPSNRAASRRHVAEVHEVDTLTSLIAQLSSIFSMLKQFTANSANNFVAQPPSPFEVVSCVYYGKSYSFENCPSNPESNNQGNGPNNNLLQHRPNQSQGFTQQAPELPQVEASNSLENLLKMCMAKNDTLIQSQATTLKNLENQIGQLATELRNRPQGTLPSNTENLRNLGKKHIKAVALRSGKILEPRFVDVKDKPIEKNQPAVQIPTPKKSESVKTDKENPNLVNSDTLTSSLDADLPTQKSYPIQLKVPSPLYQQRLQQHK